jgi:YidC/Oxa1 family membrane protein insertase
MIEAKPKVTSNRRIIFITLIIVVLIILLIARVLSITGIFNTILLSPMLNFLVLMARYLGSFGIAIIVMTILIRLLIFPLTIRQLRSSKALHDIQPKMKELQKKYGNDKQKLGQEVNKLYREAGFNPLGCFFSILLQFPIWVALYISVVLALAYTPENLFGLADRLYSPSILQNSLPLSQHFLWLNLTHGDIVMAFLEGVTMWMVQRMSTIPSPEPQQRSLNRVISWGMTLVFAFMAFILPSGLALYWVTSNVFGIVLQYQVTGWGSLRRPSLAFLKRPSPQPTGNPRAKRSATTTSTKKAGQVGTIKQVGARAGNTSSEKKVITQGDLGSPGKKVSSQEPGDERGSSQSPG